MQTQERYGDVSPYDIWMMITKRKKIILSFFLFFVTSAAVACLVMPKIYRGDVVLKVPAFEISTSNISAKELADFIGPIDAYKRAAIMPKTHDSITDIKISSLMESKDKVQVTIESKDINAFPQATTELIEYINAIELVKSTVKDEQAKLIKRSDEFSTVIASSAELLVTYSRLLKTGKLVPVGFNPVDLNKRISDIRIDKLLADQTLKRLNGGVDIARQLYVRHKPVKPKTLAIIVLAGIMGLFVGGILSFYLESIEKINNKNKEG